MSPLRLSTPASILLLAATAAAQITPGNLIVVRSGDGAAALSSTAAALFLDEFDRFTAAQPLPIQSIAMPVTISGSASSEGYITQSADGNYLIGVGYAAPAGTATVANTAATTYARIITRTSLSGTIDSSTQLSDTFSGSAGTLGNIRSAASLDGNQFWTSGNGLSSANRGVTYTTLGATTGVQLSTSPTNCRVANLFGDQIYVSTASSPFIGINAVGTGLPTTSGQTTTILSGFPAAVTGSSHYDFYLADAQTLYVADDRNTGPGGIQKWTENAGTWTLQYTLAPAVNVGCRGLSGIRDLTGTTLYATTTQASANNLVSVLDLGAGSPFTTLATAPTNTAFRGVRFVRTPYGVSFGGTGCATSAGVPTIGTSGGAPVSGNGTFGIAVGNTPAVALFITVVSIGTMLDPFGVPLSIVGGPPCAQFYLYSLDILVGGVAFGSGVAPLGLPNPDASLWGLNLGCQTVVFDDVFWTGYSLPVGTTQGMHLVIGN